MLRSELFNCIDLIVPPGIFPFKVSYSWLRV
jgi:hypothetical protein